MKFGPDITKRIAEELIKVPNVRAVCAKMGIDHSTFYRWQSHHHVFFKMVTTALAMGRDRMSEAAEGVIIRGIQNNDQKAAQYWLSHNDSRYASSLQVRKLHKITENHLDILNEPTPKDQTETAFEILFEMYEQSEKIFGTEKGAEHIRKFVTILCHSDSDLEEIFFAAYAEWKKDKDEYEAKDKKAFPDEHP